MAEVNTLACTVVANMAKSAPDTPAKNELMTNDRLLCLARFTPMASAAISSSRMALKTRP